MVLKSESLDPTLAWQPAPEEEWDLIWAAHLYRRAAFGAPAKGAAQGATAWERLRFSVDQGREQCLEQLITGGPNQATFDQLLDDMGRRFAESNELSKLQGWWLYRMLHSPHPLLERTTLLWHNHFATSVAKVHKLPLMLRQNQALRKHALGNFSPLLLEMSRDPAMLLWLDSNSNVRGKPNENYAREVMELFSLGVGNYTEKDIQEAARAFTGWRAEAGEYVFDESKHDDGSKTVLGQTGGWNGDDIVRIVLEQEVAARFLIRKLYREFISEAEVPADELIEPLVVEFRKSNYNVSACLRTMLRSRLFFSEYAYRQRVKSPVEYVVGLLTMFDARVSLEELATAMDGLGQSLFSPPNVKGWDGGAAWLNSATLMARHNLAWRLVGGQDTSLQDRIKLSPAARRAGSLKPAEQVDFFLQLTLQGDVSPDARKKLLDYARQGQEGQSSAALDERRLRELAHTVLLMPEFQLA